MSGRRQTTYHARQQFMPNRRGYRIPTHTPRIGRGCRCFGCLNRRRWTPELRQALADRMRREHLDGRSRLPANPNLHRASTWTSEQDALVRRLAGLVDVPTIAARLEQAFGYPRSEAAVKHRIKRLGIYRLDRRPLTSSEVGRIFGVTRETVRVRFVNRGLLVGRPYRGAPNGRMRVFERAELERLVREHPEAYDVDRIRDPKLKQLAVSVNRGRRLLGTSEVERLVGIGFRQLARWYADGVVPTARRVAGVRRGRWGEWLIEAGDLATVRRLRGELEERRRRRDEACPAGHPRTPENVYVEPASGQRRCRPCRFGRAHARRAS
jgi:hypothetical protein